MIRAPLYSLVFTLFFTLYVSAEGLDVPKVLAGVQVIDAAKVKSIVENESKVEEAKRNTIIVDVRMKMEFTEEHIPSAISLTYVEKSKKELNFQANQDSFDLEALNKYPAKNVVFYCNGPECWKSFKASVYALKHKLTKKIFWYRQGMPDWKKHNYPTELGLK